VNAYLTKTPRPARTLIVIWLASLLSANLALAGQTAHGLVFEDRNTDGRHDADEPGIAGVAVSNQEDVALTDAEGRYALPVTDDTILFVSIPAGYAAPVNKDNLPQFYYIHKPQGSPDLHYPGVAPTGDLPPSIDFPLLKTPETDTFRIVAMADPQPETSQEVYYIRDDVLDDMGGLDAAFGVTLGDIMSNQLQYYDIYNAAVGMVGIPFFNVIGNHDMNLDAADDRDSDETFHRWFGPNYYSWNHGKVHFVALDSVHWLGDGKGGGNYRGDFDERQMRWLANDIKSVPADHLIVLLMHIPIMTPGAATCDHTERLFNVLEKRQHILALAGHMHYHENMFLGPGNGWNGPGDFHLVINGTASGAWWSGPKDYRGIPVTFCRDGVPNGYSIITFHGADYVLDYKPARGDAAERLRIYPPGTTGDDDAARRRVVVNVYDGSARSNVEYSLDHGPFQPMTRSPQRDPLSLALLTGVLDTGKPWASVNVCQHIWEAELPERPGRGPHALTVRVTDQYGRTFSQLKVFGR
jgi:hypothetical protein